MREPWLWDLSCWYRIYWLAPIWGKGVGLVPYVQSVLPSSCMSMWLYVFIYLFCRENATGSGLGHFLLKLAQSCSLCETFRETPPGRCRFPQLPVLTSSSLCTVSWSTGHWGSCNKIPQVGQVQATQVYFSALDALSPRSRSHHGCVLVTVYWWQPSSWFIAGNFCPCPRAGDPPGTTVMTGPSFRSGELSPLFRIPEGLLPNSLLFGS